jgi:hypothetical protein
MAKHFLSVVAYVVATFAVQATSHFLINTSHYAGVTYMRKDPIFALGILSMLIEGSVLAYLYSALPKTPNWLADGLKFGWLIGAFAVGYIGLAEAAKYQVPSIGSWVLVESLTAFAQFTIYGVLVGFIQRPAARSEASRATGEVSPAKLI